MASVRKQQAVTPQSLQLTHLLRAAGQADGVQLRAALGRRVLKVAGTGGLGLPRGTPRPCSHCGAFCNGIPSHVRRLPRRAVRRQLQQQQQKRGRPASQGVSRWISVETCSTCHHVSSRLLQRPPGQPQVAQQQVQEPQQQQEQGRLQPALKVVEAAVPGSVVQARQPQQAVHMAVQPGKCSPEGQDVAAHGGPATEQLQQEQLQQEQLQQEQLQQEQQQQEQQQGEQLLHEAPQQQGEREQQAELQSPVTQLTAQPVLPEVSQQTLGHATAVTAEHALQQDVQHPPQQQEQQLAVGMEWGEVMAEGYKHHASLAAAAAQLPASPEATVQLQQTAGVPEQQPSVNADTADRQQQRHDAEAAGLQPAIMVAAVGGAPDGQPPGKRRRLSWSDTNDVRLIDSSRKPKLRKIMSWRRMARSWKAAHFTLGSGGSGS